MPTFYGTLRVGVGEFWINGTVAVEPEVWPPAGAGLSWVLADVLQPEVREAVKTIREFRK